MGKILLKQFSISIAKVNNKNNNNGGISFKLNSSFDWYEN
jgi:hypothetical protein